MNGMFLRWGLVAIFFLVIALAVRAYSSRRQQRTQLARVRSQCSDAKHTAPIFVMIVTHNNTHAAARALHSVFDQAACPFRVSVGLFETVDMDAHTDPTAMRNVAVHATPTLGAYAALAKRGTYGRSFADQVRALNVPLARAQGTHVARATLMAQAFRNQAFVLTLSDSALLTHHWDEVALSQLAKSRDPHAILVAPPTRTSLSPSGGSVPRGGSGNAWDVVADTLRHPSGSTSSLARFPVFERFSKAGLPVIGSRAFGRPPDDPAPVLFWQGDCSFAPARAYHVDDTASVPPLPTPFDGSLACLASGEDAIMSARLFTNDWAFYAPGTPLAAFQDTAVPTATQDADRAAFLAASDKMRAATNTHATCKQVMGGARKTELNALHTFDEWEAFVGLDLEKRVGGGRARMGALPSPSHAEIIAKYESLGAYNAERSAYT